ncbi:MULTISPECIES: alr0857 family protein [unclassified Chamaesiphon]|uniref:alr0857 family protein n=1 Tax=unclassified Chamaesiphon TaxID=2620921 RepID=UPI00286CBBAF|nr:MULTISPECIES: alr0857 family protein [unclassified Chamaesiphon]
MLKLIYTETSLHLELLTSDLEEWIEQRLIFDTSIGQKTLTSAEKATFLLPSLVCEATALNSYLDREGVQGVSVDRCDLDRVEIELPGYWLATDLDSAEGIFVTQLPDRVESYLWQLWDSAHNHSVTSDRAIG